MTCNVFGYPWPTFVDGSPVRKGAAFQDSRGVFEVRTIFVGNDSWTLVGEDIACPGLAVSHSELADGPVLYRPGEWSDDDCR